MTAPRHAFPGRRIASLAAAMGLIITVLAALATRRADVPEGSSSSFSPGDAEDDGTLLRSLASGDLVALEATVRLVVDGDTVVLDSDRRLRYLGIDTPEVGEPFHDQASDANRALVLGKRLRVITPRRGADRDGHGRTLAAVFVLIPPAPEVGGAERWQCVNFELVRRGLARTYFKNDDALTRALRQTLVAAQNTALDADLGVWSGIGVAGGTSEIMATRNRFHRPSCRHLRAARSPRRMDREAALRSGRSPCRSCSP